MSIVESVGELVGDVYSVTPLGMVTNVSGELFGPAVLNATDQAQNIDAIDVYISGATPLNSKATQLRDEWMQWVSGLSWYQKHVDESVAAEAFNRRNAFMRANVLSKEEQEKVDEFLKKPRPVVDPVTGKTIHVTSTGDRVVPPKPLVPTQYKVVAVATAAGVSVLVLLKKLHIL
jgi:hypothetical protein